MYGREKTAGGWQLDSDCDVSGRHSVCRPVTSPEELWGQLRIHFAERRSLVSPENLVMSPRAECDFTSSKLAFRLPVNLAPNNNKALLGGVECRREARKNTYVRSDMWLLALLMVSRRG